MNPQSSYDFIMNPGQPPKRSLSAGPVAGKRMFILIGVVVVLFLFFFIGLALKGGGGASAKLTSVAETQTEIVRVATEGSSNVTSTANQNLAINVQLTVASQLSTLKKFLTTHGTKVSAKTLGLKKNTATDTQLKTAQQNSSYDTVFAQIMQTELGNYLSELRSAYQAASGPKTRALLSTDYTQAAMLYKQIPSAAELQQN